MKIIANTKIKWALRLSFGIAILVVLFVWVDFSSMLNLYSRVGWKSFAILFLIGMIDRVLMAYKWGILIRPSNAKVRLWSLVKAYYYSSFLGPFLLASVGEDLVRFCSVLRSEASVSRENLLASILVEKIIGVFSMSIMTVAAILWFFFNVSRNIQILMRFVDVSLVVIVLLFGSFVIIWLYRKRTFDSLLSKYGGKFGRSLKGVVKNLKGYWEWKKALISFFLLTLLEQLISVLLFYILACALGISVLFAEIFFVSTISLFLSRMPISIGGIGIFEALFASLFFMLGLNPEEGVALSLGFRIVGNLFPAPVVAVYFWDTIRTVREGRKEGDWKIHLSQG